MFSTRKFVIGASLLTAATMLGCQAKVPEGVERLNNAPLIVDEAMQKREWDRSTSYYPNGDTVADGTGYMFETHETIPDGWFRWNVSGWSWASQTSRGADGRSRSRAASSSSRPTPWHSRSARAPTQSSPRRPQASVRIARR